jgi:putative endonuclease
MYVYIIRSLKRPDQTYVGSSQDFKKRLVEHNSGKSTHTSKFKPRKLEIVVWFDNDLKAIEFEKYLKNHSGRAFREKHF